VPDQERIREEAAARMVHGVLEALRDEIPYKRRLKLILLLHRHCLESIAFYELRVGGRRETDELGIQATAEGRLAKVGI
jgi:hypothetical protein